MTEPVRVLGTGPSTARIMAVGEAFGENEEREGRPFCGRSGDELDRYLSSVRVGRDEVYVTNVVNERPPGNADPTAAMIAAHEVRLGEELLTVRPRYVLAIGRFALRWFANSADVRIDREYGLPFYVELCGVHGWPAKRCAWEPECGRVERLVVNVTAVHHPAFGLYSPDEQNLIQRGFDMFGATLRGEQVRRHDEHESPQYTEITEDMGSLWSSGAELLRSVLAGALYDESLARNVIAIDTEGSVDRPWCLSFSVRPGEAWVIRAGSPLLRKLAAWITETDPLVVLHNAVHDIEVLAALGVRVTRFADTMVVAYLLGPHYPQALKSLAYRELGMLMRDYDDVVGKASRRLAVEYLRRVLVDRRCSFCRGEGERAWWTDPEITPAHTRTVSTKNGPRLRRFKEKIVPARLVFGKCDQCGGDGTEWKKPEPLTVWENGCLRSWQPTAVGARGRRILADVEAGKAGGDGEPTDPRARWEATDPPEAIAEVTAALGPMPAATLDDVPLHEAIDYAARDADATLRAWLRLDPLLDEWGLRDVYGADLAIVPLVVEMQQAGLPVDVAYYVELERELVAELQQITHQLRRLVGYYVNPASSKQVASLLFGKLRLHPVKRTKSKAGESTDDKVLQQLRISQPHPALDLILRHRELHKLVGTYVRPLASVRPDAEGRGRVYCEFKLTRTATGRMASAKPRRVTRRGRTYIQGQNIPTRTKDGKRVRAGVVAPDGYVLASYDLSQIEWRVLAHLTQDTALMEIFRTGADMHVMTAAKMWKIAADAVTAEQRSRAKNTGFGIGYGISAKGLVVQFAVRGITITEQQAQEFITGFLGVYPGIVEFWQSTYQQARRDGYVRSPSGRIRWVQAIRSTAPWVREEAERQAGNFPVQEFAAYAIKRIMERVHGRLLPAMRRHGWNVLCLLQEHDALTFQLPEECVPVFDALIRAIMSSTVRLSVPVTCDGKVGKRWSDLKE